MSIPCRGLQEGRDLYAPRLSEMPRTLGAWEPEESVDPLWSTWQGWLLWRSWVGAAGGLARNRQSSEAKAWRVRTEPAAHWLTPVVLRHEGWGLGDRTLRGLETVRLAVAAERTWLRWH